MSSVGRCTICQETFDPSEVAALRCGHTFHLQCVTQWLTKAKSCPVCRRPTKASTDLVEQLFFDIGEDSMVFGTPTQSTAVSSRKLNELTEKVQKLEAALKASREELAKTTAMSTERRDRLNRLTNEHNALLVKMDNQRTRIALMDRAQQHHKASLERLQKELDKLQSVKALIIDHEGDIDIGNMDVMKTSMGIMKKKFDELSAEKGALAQRAKAMERENAALKKEKDELYILCKNAQQGISTSKVESQEQAQLKLPMASVALKRIDSDSEDDCHVYNVPGSKMALRSKPNNDDAQPLAAASAITGACKRTTATSRGKTAAASGKRFDGFGGQATSSMASTSASSTSAATTKKKPVVKATPIKRKAPARKAPAAKMPATKTTAKRQGAIQNENYDVVVLSDSD